MNVSTGASSLLLTRQTPGASSDMRAFASGRRGMRCWHVSCSGFVTGLEAVIECSEAGKRQCSAAARLCSRGLLDTTSPRPKERMSHMQVTNPIYAGGSYDIIQTVFKLSRFSNLGDNLEGSASDIQQQLGPVIDDALTKHSEQLGVWTRVWGPCVFQADKDCSGKSRVSKVADHVMYVAYNTSANCYVVAVAGTNGNKDGDHNWYDTDCLDDNVTVTTGFPLGINPANGDKPDTKNVGYVSQGAAWGTTNLLNMQDPKTQKTIQSFLKDNESSQGTLIFAGHSLGGSLSPTLALWLYPNAFAASRWGALYVLPTAAPSTGDRGFVNVFSAIFPPTAIRGIANYGFWNQVIWNQYDVVPHGWTNLMNIQPFNVQNDVVWDYVQGKSCQTLYGPLSGLSADIVYDAINAKYQLLRAQIPT
ncbi:lipase family protein [Myxococcus xanthus]|nr:hypothetical protein [Myxococcus xanthus]